MKNSQISSAYGDQDQNNSSAYYLFTNVPPAFRFRPKDEELIQYFLRPKIMNSRLPPNEIREARLNDYHPRDLCHTHDKQYFFTLRETKYAKGIRPNRITGGNGFWKATGGDVKINVEGREIGRKKSLVYYEGKTKDQSEVKTNWIMHEYRIDPKTSHIPIRSTSTKSINTMVDYNWVVCMIYYQQSSKPPKEVDDQSHERNLPTETSDDRGEQSIAVPYVPVTPAELKHVQQTVTHQPSNYTTLAQFGHQRSTKDYKQRPFMDEYPLPEFSSEDFLEDDGHLESLIIEDLRRHTESIYDFGYWGD